MPATTISRPIGTTKYYGVKPQTPYDYYLNGQGGYGTPPAGAIPADQYQAVGTTAGQKYTGATPYSWLTDVAVRGHNFIAPPDFTPATSAGTGTPVELAPRYSYETPMSPAGNNITSGTANPTTTFGNTPTVPTAPNTGTGAYSPDTSFLNPASGTAGTKRKAGANKYFNQQWFGGKQIA